MEEGFCSHLPYGFVVTASREIAKIQRQTFFLGLAIFFGKLLAARRTRRHFAAPLSSIGGAVVDMSAADGESKPLLQRPAGASPLTFTSRHALLRPCVAFHAAP